MTADRFLELAKSYLGYRASPGGRNDFAARTGYTSTGAPWSGSFIDCVAYDASVKIPACVYSPNGLAEFIYQRRWRERPQPGDIVFYSFSLDGAFGMPHVGIVTNIDGWKISETFTAIEANISSGLPKAPDVNDGIFERTRWKYEVLGFCRPDFKQRPAKDSNILTGKPELLTSQLLPGKRHASVEILQRALVVAVGLKDYERGKFDAKTQRAYARFQRLIGIAGSDANGVPTQSTLTRLALETQMFKI
jgi:hypothetical protein